MHSTKTDVAVQVLRRMIRDGDLSPGAPIQAVKLSKELEMSATPIREAIRLLQADGTLVYRPHQGAAVAELSADRVREVYMLRGELEPLAVRLAAERLDAKLLVRLEELNQQFAVAIASTNGASVATERNADLHWFIYNNCGSPMLIEFISRLWGAAPWRSMFSLPGRAADSLKEHFEIITALRAGDGECAAAAMRAHVFSSEYTALTQVEADASTQVEGDAA